MYNATIYQVRVFCLVNYSQNKVLYWILHFWILLKSHLNDYYVYNNNLNDKKLL